MDEKASAKFLRPEVAPLLEALADEYRSLTSWEADALKACLEGYTERHQLAMKSVAQPLRVALTGRTASPGLFEVMVVLGKATTLARLERGAELARAAGNAG